MSSSNRPSTSGTAATSAVAGSKVTKRSRVVGTQRPLQISSANEKVWLFKVPKYLAQEWLSDQYGNEAIIAKLSCSLDQKTNTKSRFRLRPVPPTTPKPSTSTSEKDSVCFRDYEFHINPIRSNGPKMCIMQDTRTIDLSTTANNKNPKQPGGSNVNTQNRNSNLLGTVSARVDCRPVAVDNSYMKRIRDEISLANRPKGEIIFIENAKPTFKPVADHRYNIDQKAKTKAEGKNIRRAEDDVRSDLFSAFERHQFYKISDLVTITKQPVPHLKGILQEIADYSVKPPYRNMWQLKPEYRHYLGTKPDGD